jgi:uncharacterized protein YoxC
VGWIAGAELALLVVLAFYMIDKIDKLAKRLELITNRLMALQSLVEGLGKGQDNIWDKVFEIEARGRPEIPFDP